MLYLKYYHMPVSIGSKQYFTGSVTTAVGTEVTVIELIRNTTEEEFVAEGYIDLSAIASGDSLVVSEYIDPNGTGYRLYTSVPLTYPLDAPLIWFHSKIIGNKYKVTVKQLTGRSITIPYWFWKLVYSTV